MPEGQEASPKAPGIEASASSPKISPGLLSSLGLTLDDVMKYENITNPITRESKGLNLIEEGSQAYDNMRTRIEAGEEDACHFILIKVEGKLRTRLEAMVFPRERKTEILEQVPDQLIKDLKQTIRKYGRKKPQVLEAEIEALSQLKDWLRGFGNRALVRDDWGTAVNALDLATDGGFINDAEVMGKLRELASADKMKGVEIARVIQGRIDKRAKTAQPAVQTTPTT